MQKKSADLLAVAQIASDNAAALAKLSAQVQAIHEVQSAELQAGATTPEGRAIKRLFDIRSSPDSREALGEWLQRKGYDKAGSAAELEVTTRAVLERLKSDAPEDEREFGQIIARSVLYSMAEKYATGMDLFVTELSPEVQASPRGQRLYATLCAIGVFLERALGDPQEPSPRKANHVVVTKLLQG